MSPSHSTGGLPATAAFAGFVAGCLPPVPARRASVASSYCLGTAILSPQVLHFTSSPAYLSSSWNFFPHLQAMVSMAAPRKKRAKRTLCYTLRRACSSTTTVGVSRVFVSEQASIAGGERSPAVFNRNSRPASPKLPCVLFVLHRTRPQRPMATTDSRHGRRPDRPCVAPLGMANLPRSATRIGHKVAPKPAGGQSRQGVEAQAHATAGRWPSKNSSGC